MRLEELETERIGVCLSGGLSCLAVSAWMTECGLDTVNLIADIGQADPGELRDLASLLSSKGMPTHVVDARAEMAEMALELVKYQATYEGGYWNTTGASRAVIVRTLAPVMREHGCTVLVHGSVGGGNDQQRFDRCARMLAPGLKPFAPWETPQLLKRFPGRAQMVEYLDAIGLKRAPESDESCSIDANLAGISHEGAALEDLATPSAAVQPVMGVRPQDAPDDVEVVTIRVERGRPVAINGERMTPLACLGLANRIAGRNGLWMRDVVENRINATKCRGLYEAPGMELFGQCVRATYEATVEKHANQLLGSLSALIGKSVYEGRYFDVATRAACAAVDIIAEDATAVVHGHLYNGSLVARSLTEVAHAPGVARQTRFAVGGHRWQVTPDLVQAGGSRAAKGHPV